MASPAEIANDLDAQAKYLQQSRFDRQAVCLRRGAGAIRELLASVQKLEAAARTTTRKDEDQSDGAS